MLQEILQYNRCVGEDKNKEEKIHKNVFEEKRSHRKGIVHHSGNVRVFISHRK